MKNRLVALMFGILAMAGPVMAEDYDVTDTDRLAGLYLLSGWGVAVATNTSWLAVELTPVYPIIWGITVGPILEAMSDPEDRGLKRFSGQSDGSEDAKWEVNPDNRRWKRLKGYTMAGNGRDKVKVALASNSFIPQGVFVPTED